MHNSQGSKSYLIVVVLFSLLLVPIELRAQRQRPVANPEPSKKATPPVPKALFDVSGLTAADFYRFIHDGRFNRFENDLRFKMTFETYVTVFSENCRQYMSKDSTEITKWVDTYRSETTFIWAGRGLPIPVTSDRLESSKEVGTGYFAEPGFDEEYRKLTAGYMRELLTRVDIRNPSALLDTVAKTVGDLVALAIQSRSDMGTMLVSNGCNNPQTKRFSNNLLRFAKGGQSLQAENGEKPYFEKECESKLPKLFPKAIPGACACIHREMSAALPLKSLEPLEDKFDSYDFKLFMMMSVYKAGLQHKVSACIRP